MSLDEPLPVEFDELLAAEFSYIAQTAIQANEDRARVSSFYLIAVGSLVAAMFGAQYIDTTWLSIDPGWLFSALFALLTLMGTSTILQLARLRSAWFDSAMAMNQIKDYMMSRNQSLRPAFRWQTGTLPAKFKKDSISYYQAMEVAVISGLMFGAAVLFLLQALLSLGVWSLPISVVFGVASAFGQLSLYRRALK